MNRFKKKSQRSLLIPKFLPLLLFFLVLILFLLGLSSVSAVTKEEEAERLRTVIIQSAVQCYSLEGFYPDTLAYLEDHYALSYDRNKYLVSYEIIGSNMMPGVTVIPLKDREGGNP